MSQITLQSILKDSNYDLALFTEAERKVLESKIIDKGGKPYVICIIRNKEILLKPEEIIRQLYTTKLINQYGYPSKKINFEYPVQFGRETKSADIVIFDKIIPRPHT